MNEIKVSTSKEKRLYERVAFKDIEEGDIFRYGRDIYIKVQWSMPVRQEESATKDYNAINLSDREHRYASFNWSDLVEGYIRPITVDDCYFTDNKSLYDNAKEEYKKSYEKN